MKKYQNITGITIAGLIVLAIAVIGVVANQASADVVYPGTASAWVYLKLTCPQKQDITAKVTLTPSTGKKFYFKERSFGCPAGQTTYRWVVRKIPQGSYTVTMTSASGTFAPLSFTPTLQNDISNYIGEFDLDLGGGTVLTTPTVVPVTSTPTAAATIDLNSLNSLQPGNDYTVITSPDGNNTATGGSGTSGQAPGPPLPILE